MEPETRFDLTRAITNWRDELAAQPSLTDEDRRELEIHLRDAIAGFRQRGLNEEESFMLACWRVGQPQKLGEEFEKADPAKVWRERVFWMCLAVFLINVFGTLVGAMEMALLPVNSGRRSVDAANLALALWPVLTPMALMVIVLLMRSEKIIRSLSKLGLLFESRLRLAITAIVLIVLSSIATVVSREIYESRIKGTFRPNHWEVMDQNCLLLLIFALIVIWLMPARKAKRTKHA